jgi:CRP/FNR family cyclic AMP-dependent transcriptional regulator
MTTEAELIEVMKGTMLFGGLDAVAARALLGAMREVRFAARQTIFTRDDTGSSLLLLLKGRVRLSVINSEGRELTFRYAERGDVLGEIAALDGDQRTADCVAVTPVRAMTLAPAALWRLIETQPPLARAVIEFLCKRLRDTSDQLEGIALYTIEARVARFLLSALKLSGASLESEEASLDLNMTQNEMALLLGTGRPRISVALSALEDQGALRRDGERLICRPAVLSDIVGAAEV